MGSGFVFGGPKGYAEGENEIVVVALPPGLVRMCSAAGDGYSVGEKLVDERGGVGDVRGDFSQAVLLEQNLRVGDEVPFWDCER